MLHGVEGGHREREARAEGQLAQIAAQQERAASVRRAQPGNAGRGAGQHRGREIHPDDLVAGAQQRQQQTPGAAADVQDRPAALVGQRLIKPDIRATSPILPVVELRVVERAAHSCSLVGP